MSERSNHPNLDLVLNITPATVANHRVESPNVSISSSELSQESSCVSSEPDNSYGDSRSRSRSEYLSGGPVVTPMLLVGCPRCFMYVMLSETEVDPKCPQCKSSTVFLDFLNQENIKWTRD
ncbi:hypothetical protein V6N13_056189 [Hibiscus sabdariffa]|uniref:GIR1-like zinc ribbon domain-containing protein n=1 Tax=Hibiscus sabdariffa TaxID=183260 RepID=A0ABR2BCJ9_9ROSI